MGAARPAARALHSRTHRRVPRARPARRPAAQRRSASTPRAATVGTTRRARSALRHQARGGGAGQRLLFRRECRKQHHGCSPRARNVKAYVSSSHLHTSCSRDASGPQCRARAESRRSRVSSSRRRKSCATGCARTCARSPQRASRTSRVAHAAEGARQRASAAAEKACSVVMRKVSTREDANRAARRGVHRRHQAHLFVLEFSAPCATLFLLIRKLCWHISCGLATLIDDDDARRVARSAVVSLTLARLRVPPMQAQVIQRVASRPCHGCPAPSAAAAPAAGEYACQRRRRDTRQPSGAPQRRDGEDKRESNVATVGGN